MVVHNHLSSDISTNLMVASIAEELTKTLKQIGIDKTDQTKILKNLLEINAIVERSKCPNKFNAFKSQLEEILTILSEPIHKSWLEKILMKTENLIGFMKDSERRITTPEPDQNLRNEDIIRQCFNEWNKTIKDVSKEKKVPVITPKHSNVKIIHWDHANSFLSESEVLIVNYSRIRHEKSLELGSADMEGDKNDTQRQLKITSEDLKDEGIKKEEKDETIQELKDIQRKFIDDVKLKLETQTNELSRQSPANKHSKENFECKEKDKLPKLLKTEDVKINLKFEDFVEKYDRPVKLIDDKIVSDNTEKEVINDLDSDLRQYLFKKISSTKTLGKQNQDINGCKNDENSHEKHPKIEKLREVFEELNKRMSEENGTREKNKTIIQKQPEKEISEGKSKRRRERKCNLSGHRNKTKQKEVPSTTMKLMDTPKSVSRKKLNLLGHNFSLPSVRQIDTGESRTPNKITNISHATTTTEHYVPEMDNPEELLQYLGKISYKKLFTGKDFSSSKADNILTNNMEKSLADKRDKEATGREPKGKRRISKRHTKHRSWGDKYLKPEDVEELKTRCKMIRKELESIESKARSLKSRQRNRKNNAGNDRQDILGMEKSHLSSNHVGYLCTIM